MKIWYVLEKPKEKMLKKKTSK